MVYGIIKASKNQLNRLVASVDRAIRDNWILATPIIKISHALAFLKSVPNRGVNCCINSANFVIPALNPFNRVDSGLEQLEIQSLFALLIPDLNGYVFQTRRGDT
jgi:hypothetical protein